jgi:hypothetical protein
MRIMHGSGRLVIAAITAVSVYAAPGAAQPARRPVFAVLDFHVSATRYTPDERSELAGYGPTFAEILSTAWSARGDVTLVERRRVDAVLKEQQLAADGRVDDNTAARVGRLLGATHVLLGSVHMERGTPTVRVALRAVRVETGLLERGVIVRGRESGLLDDLGDRLVDSLARVLAVRVTPTTGDPSGRGGDAARTDEQSRRASLSLAGGVELERRGQTGDARSAYRAIAGNDSLPSTLRQAAEARLASLPDSISTPH